MEKGLSTSGKIVDTNDSGEVIEIICRDPMFIEKASLKRPSFIARVFYGAYSFPRDWWCGILYCYAQTGFFGSEQRRRSNIWRRDLESILDFVEKNPETTIRILNLYFSDRSSTADFRSRFVGGLLTGYASTGGRIGRTHLNLPTRLLAPGANFILASTGAAILAVKNGARDIVSVFDSMITGNYQHSITSEEYKELFRSAMEKQEPLTQSEADNLVGTVRVVLHCLRNAHAYTKKID